MTRLIIAKTIIIQGVSAQIAGCTAIKIKKKILNYVKLSILIAFLHSIFL